MATTAAALWLETTVPITMKRLPDDVEAQVGDQAGRDAPGELHQQQEREGTESPEQPDLGIREQPVGQGEDRRHHDGRPNRALDHEELGILRLQPSGDPDAKCPLAPAERRRPS